MTTERLFAVEPTTRERAQRRATNRARQTVLFTVERGYYTQCPACGGDEDSCSCATTGAEALELELT